MRDYDKDTAFLGDWGRFQQVVFFLLCASAVPNGFNALSIVFLGDSPPHHCQIPVGINLTEEWRQVSIPTQLLNGETVYDRCRRYKLDLISNFSAQGLSPGKDVNLSQVPLEGCSDGWSFSKEIYQSTIVTEFDLVCGNEWKQPFTTSVYFIGVFFGSFFSGQLSDRFGRKRILFISMAIQSFFTLVQAFSPSWEVFATLFFLVGLGQMSNYVATFVLGAETFTGTPRAIYSSFGICGSFAIGYMVLPLFAYFIRDWRKLMFITSLPSIIYIPFWWISALDLKKFCLSYSFIFDMFWPYLAKNWLIPESPRWLLSQGRVEEAEAILRAAARKNRVTAPKVIFPQTEKRSDREESHGVLELLKTSNMRYIALIMCVVWFAISVGYFGLSLNTSKLHGNPYLNCFISAAIEMPAYFASWLALQYLPRRLSLALMLLSGGGFLLLLQLIPPDLTSLAISLEMVGKFCMAGAGAFAFPFSGELFPTILRNTAIGACSTTARFGSALTPFLLHLGGQYKKLPYILLGTLAIISGAITFLLPETIGRPLPQTIEQMPRRERVKWPCRSSEQKKGKMEKILAETHM